LPDRRRTLFLARVIGTVVSTVKNQHFRGDKLLAVQPLGLEGESRGASLLAIDSVDAGEGDVVLVIREGGSARIVLGDEMVPVQCVVVGVVDRIDIDPRFHVAGGS
jgi:ethanolamine utilization protein EutN